MDNGDWWCNAQYTIQLTCRHYTGSEWPTVQYASCLSLNYWVFIFFDIYNSLPMLCLCYIAYAVSLDTLLAPHNIIFLFIDWKGGSKCTGERKGDFYELKGKNVDGKMQCSTSKGPSIRECTIVKKKEEASEESTSLF